MVNGTMMQFFYAHYPADGSLWNHACEKASELKDLGITAVWLPPASKGSEGANASGYDAYDLYDLGEFDQKGSVRTRYGTKAELQNAIRTLNEKNIGVYADVVLNHKSGADEKEKIKVYRVNPENRKELMGEPIEIEAYTRFTFPGRKGKYSQFIWDHRCFSGVDYADNLNEQAIYTIVNEYGVGWQPVVAREKGNYDYLMGADIEFRNPYVREELRNWGAWFLQEAPFAGVRLDAVKHMTPGFIAEWLDFMRNLKQDLFAVGEYWAPEDLSIMMQFMEATGARIALFDAPLHNNLFTASNQGKDYDLRQVLNNCILEKKPELAVTIVSNHDTQPLELLEATVQSWFKPLAYALILLRDKGYPCVFYGDLYGGHYFNKGPDGNEHEIWLEKCANLDKLLIGRQRYAYGLQRDYFDDPNCIGWTREGDAAHPRSGCAVILTNGDATAKSMEIGASHAGRLFSDLLGNHPAQIRIGDNGWAEFPVSPGSVSVWVQHGQPH
ncbi:alpha-amylase [Longitalea arenae]|uniref:alpha-amylase n=1 Tax=Longitalea arenae TaxID=2812558 RepID=UPI0021063E68|nr:alpha-amylase [Longitalea arenae]